jgi:rubredoxin-NAD+ reductase
MRVVSEMPKVPAAPVTRHPVIIVGAGMAGFSVARELKARGVGPVLMLSADEGRFYAKPLLSHTLSREKPAAKLLMDRAACEEQYGVRIFPHTAVVGFDTARRRLTTAAGATFDYEHLVLATGAAPVAPWEGPRIFSVNSAADMHQMEPALARAQRVLVAGAGFVGLEMANDWLRAGKNVTVAAAAAPLHQVLPAVASAWVQQRLEAAGIVFGCGQVTLASEIGYVKASVDGVPLPAPFDMVLSAIGLRSNTTLAQAGGLATGAHGLLVDADFVTSDPHVLALGDVIEQHGRPWRFVAAHNHAAKVIAGRLAGGALPAAPARMPISLKCPDAPLMMVLPNGTGTVHWEQVVASNDELELRATRFGEACGYVLGGVATGRRARLDAWLNVA